MKRTALVLGLTSLVGCTPNDDCAKGAAAPAGADAVSILTEDAICLVADHYRASAGAPAVVFLHMNPQTWDRKSWSADYIRSINAKGWAVLNLDRRGAGDSLGEATQAFEGDGGQQDVLAAVRYLVGEGAGQIGIIAASNGTTSALDYAVWASSRGEVAPVSIVMMSPGSYTENQTSISALAAIDTQVFFQYDPDEGFWIEDTYDDLNDGNWERQSYPGAGHGSQMLDFTPEVGTDAVDFLDDRWSEFP